MNVLLLVSTMLTLLTIMTYTRLQTFLDTAGIRMEYEQYMMHTERREIDGLETDKYRNTQAKSDAANQKKVEPAEEDKEAKDLSFSLLNLQPLLVSANKEGNDEAAQEAQVQSSRVMDTIKILQRLVANLYESQRFYKEAEEKYPELPEELVKQMVLSVDDAPCKLKFTSKKDLAHIPMKDAEMREIYYKMLKGQEASFTTDDKGKKKETGKGYKSILSYITLKKKPSGIRVYLARRELLTAIFRDPEPIITRRTELYRQVKEGLLKPEDATKDFAGLFKDTTNTDINLNMLDFTVTKTAPPDRSKDSFSPSEE